MAEEDDTERSEDPTQKRLDEAIERGDVVKSQEVNTWFVLGTATLILLSFSGSMSSSLLTMMRGLLANADGLPVDGRGLVQVMQSIGLATIAAIAVPFALLMLGAIVGNVIQHRLVWSTEGLTPKFSKISPAAGLKRLFSKIALANFVKGLIKLTVLGSVMTAILYPKRRELDAMVAMDPAVVLPKVQDLTLEVLGIVIAILAIVAAADYLLQYRTWYERQKMSLRELKEEFRQTEGDPAVKAKIRQLRHQRSKKRMMADVQKASVIITNPTHYSVALQYDKGMAAPICVAKGIDAIALKIREVATEHGIPIVENVPLARALHATVEIDEEVPPEHYKAVAEVIGYVMRLKGTLRR